VIDVLNLYRTACTGEGVHLASARALDPPHHLWDGLQHYAAAVNKIRQHDRDKAAKKRKQGHG